jgi:hypothetical protein
MNVGEIEVHIVSNAACIRVTHEDIRDLEAFSAMLFGQLLKLMKSFLIVDKDNKENSYFVVPTQVGKTVLVLLMYEVPVGWRCDYLIYICMSLDGDWSVMLICCCVFRNCWAS